MTLDPAQARALGSLDNYSTDSLQRGRTHKRQRSQTIGTTFVTTTVVPASSSADVLSSLISSLTVLSDTAREQIRSTRELGTCLSDSALDQNYPGGAPAAEYSGEAITSYEPQTAVVDLDRGEVAEAPIIGYSRGRSREQSKRASAKEKWAVRGSGREVPVGLPHSGSSHTLRRPPSGASPGIGIPSIERGRTSSSSNSLPISPSTSTKSPLRMFFTSRVDDEPIQPSTNSAKDFDSKSAKSIKSFKTTKSKQSTTVSVEQEREREFLAQAIDTAVDEAVELSLETPPTQIENRHYSPLSPTVREDLADHLIPSRRSSMRHSPVGRRSSKGRSPSAGRRSLLPARSPSAVKPDGTDAELNEEPLEEEDSTLRRIRELKQARERRQQEWGQEKESRRSERKKRSSGKRAKSKEPGADGVKSTNPLPELQTLTVNYEEKSLPTVPRQHSDPESVPTSAVTTSGNIVLPPRSHTVPTPYSPTTTSYPHPRKHKRSLSAGLRRSTSLRQRQEDVRSVSDQIEAFLSAPRLTQRIRHPRTGRTVAFSEVGDPKGFAVFCCVGMGLTRYVTTFYDDFARTQKLRLITPDRPGIGESSPFSENVCTPLAWVDDVAVICQSLNIEKFSLMAHSAGSIYALATALKMPDRIRGKIHLLAPWIPPSQFPSGSGNGQIKAANLPMAHKLLSVLPAPFLKAANSRFLSSTSASLEPRSGKSRKKDQSMSFVGDDLLTEMAADVRSDNLPSSETAPLRYSSLSQLAATPSSTPPPYSLHNSAVNSPVSSSPTSMRRQMSSANRMFRSPTPGEMFSTLSPQEKQSLFNSELTHRTWALATLNANPAADLVVCLERRRTIGFKYTEVTRNVVIHHGSEDARVPLDNVQWLSKVMKNCELRVLEGESHGLMASANVMSMVIGEIGREWEEYDTLARRQEKKQRDLEAEAQKVKEMERRRFVRQAR